MVNSEPAYGPERRGVEPGRHQVEPEPDRPVGRQQADRGRYEREQQRLDEQLSDDARAARAKRRPYGDFTLARRRARVDECAHVHARDEQHEQRGYVSRREQRPVHSRRRRLAARRAT